jgi:SAM-dependent methyltransferase
MMPDEDRLRLRHTFNAAAGSYSRVRPDDRGELLDELGAVAGRAPGDRLLEGGCGPGKATIPLARRGFRITCIELGAELAAAARRNLAGLDAWVIEGRFEEWQPRPGERFDLVYAATAWHWIDPAVRYRRAWQVLRPGGHLAFWSALHVFPDGGDPFFREIQEVYEEIGEGPPPGEGFPRPGELWDQGAEIGASGLFEVAAIRHFDWARAYDAASHSALPGPSSGHIALQQWQQDRLYEEIRHRLARRPGHAVRRHWGAVLHIARRRG